MFSQNVDGSENAEPSIKEHRRRQATRELVVNLNLYVATVFPCVAAPSLKDKFQAHRAKFTPYAAELLDLILEWEAQLGPPAPTQMRYDDPNMSVYMISEVEIVGTFCEAALELRAISLAKPASS
eukprot:TRINITY_DN25444_c0_g1_i4.p4 TRINITY_DN25444_c0_g1~~TRINITY_DN25444_c0_g1_i4.p4  ORF type:complete len:125 (-),score=29.56 TRINITY_DN25444_c0_g1_i4:234-608(-)